MIFIDGKPAFSYITTKSTILGQILADMRCVIGATQKDMADTLNIHQSQWNRREHGISDVSFCEMQAAASFLGLNITTLVALYAYVESKLQENNIGIDMSGKSIAELETQNTNNAHHYLFGTNLRRYVSRHVDDYLNLHKLSLCH